MFQVSEVDPRQLVIDFEEVIEWPSVDELYPVRREGQSWSDYYGINDCTPPAFNDAALSLAAPVASGPGACIPRICVHFDSLDRFQISRLDCRPEFYSDQGHGWLDAPGYLPSGGASTFTRTDGFLQAVWTCSR